MFDFCAARSQGIRKVNLTYVQISLKMNSHSAGTHESVGHILSDFSWNFSRLDFIAYDRLYNGRNRSNLLYLWAPFITPVKVFLFAGSVYGYGFVQYMFERESVFKDELCYNWTRGLEEHVLEHVYQKVFYYSGCPLIPALVLSKKKCRDKGTPTVIYNSRDKNAWDWGWARTHWADWAVVRTVRNRFFPKAV